VTSTDLLALAEIIVPTLSHEQLDDVGAFLLAQAASSSSAWPTPDDLERGRQSREITLPDAPCESRFSDSSAARRAGK
jgi:hypothetical protein